MGMVRRLNLRQVAPPALGALAALALLWAVRAAPLAAPPLVAADALSAFFAFATFLGLALAAAAPPPGGARTPWLAVAAVTAAYLTPLTPLVAAAYLALAALVALPRPRPRPAFTWPVAALLLAVGYGALALRGALRYDERAAGAALDGFVFWFVLLAAAAPLLPIQDQERTAEDEGRRARDQGSGTNDHGGRSPWVAGLRSLVAGPFVAVHVLRVAWLYPLARLYTLGPWNEGWSFAAILFGGALALWAVGGALAGSIHEGYGGALPDVRPHEPVGSPVRALRALRGSVAGVFGQRASEANPRALLALAHLGMALAGFGLSTGAGLAAGCYSLLTYLILAAARGGQPAVEDARMDPRIAPLAWLLTPAVPFAAPFVAAWMLLGAGVAGGVALLGAVAWLVALLGAVACVLAPPWTPSRRALLVGAGASFTLGVLAPAAVRMLVQPAIEQLQGGLSVHGDVNIWPWVGLAAVDSSRRGVTALPSIAAALLMLVLSALVYLAARLRQDLAAGPEDSAQEPAVSRRALSDTLRDEVPWLGARPRGEERPGDDR